MIDLEFTDDQLQLQATVRRLLDERGGLASARDVFEQRRGYSAEIWRALVEMDVIGLAIPTELGGSGGGLLDITAVCIETGRAGVASPLVPSSVVAATAIAAAQVTSPHHRELIARIANGQATVATALAGVALSVSGHLSTQVSWRLTGNAALVAFADTAERILARVDTDQGPALLLVDPTADGVTLTPLDNIAGLPLFHVELDNVAVTTDDLAGAPGQADELLRPAVGRGAVLRAAEIAGAGERLLEMVVDYATQRTQFGRAIGSYQAVQYLCTDIAIDAHLCTLLAKRAAWLVDTAQPAQRSIAAAKLHASRAAAHMAQQAHEVFAGIGYMAEHDLHLLTRQLKFWEHDLGGVREHSEALVDALVAEVSGAPS